MRINQTQNSPDFRAKFFVADRVVEVAAAARTAIEEGCRARRILCHTYGGSFETHKGVQVFRMPILTDEADIAEFRGLKSHPSRIHDFIPQENILNANEVLTVIKEDRFDYLNGVILQK